MLFRRDRSLYFTSTNPRHKYKSERFFTLFFQLRRKSRFGSRSFSSNFKKMLIVKKFFMWYYFVPTNRFFKKLFHRVFLKKRVSFGLLGSFFHMLERNILVLLVRLNWSMNIVQSLALVKASLITVNGGFVTRNFYATKIGDVVEFFNIFFYILSYLFMRKRLRIKRYRNFFFLPFQVNWEKLKYTYTSKITTVEPFHVRNLLQKDNRINVFNFYWLNNTN